MADSIYTKLDSPAHIRVVRLYPAEANLPINAELVTPQSIGEVLYEALSYVWGDTSGRFSIVLNGRITHVSDNLYLALRRLLPVSGTRLLWIDQLCINQSDNVERGQQVELMGLIYSRATQALLWLGDEPHMDGTAVKSDQIRIPKTVPCIWSREDIEVGSGTGLSNYLPKPVDDSEYSVSTAPEEDMIYHAFLLIAQLASSYTLRNIRYLASEDAMCVDTIRALWFIMARPWWNRMWTLQECILPRKALLLYGPVTAPFEMFLDAAAFYTEQATYASGEFVLRLRQTTVDTLRSFCHTMNTIGRYRRQIIRGQKLDLTSILRDFRPRQTSDFHDKIYGLLGLPVDWHDHEPLRADYELSVAETYRLSTLKTIQCTQSLGIFLNNFDKRVSGAKLGSLFRPIQRFEGLPGLDPAKNVELIDLIQQIDSLQDEFVQQQNLLDGEREIPQQLPSWVPDWSVPANLEVVPRYQQAEMYSAAGPTTASARSIDAPTLALGGIQVDTVRWSSQIMAHSDPADRASLFADWRAYAADATAYDASGRWEPRPGAPPTALDDAFWRTLCGDTVALPDGAGIDASSPTFRRARAEDYAEFLAWCATHAPVLVTASAALSGAAPGGATAPASGGIMEPAVRAATTMRRVFVTKRGLLGLAPPGVVGGGGEGIFILRGGKAPFILRRRVESGVTGPQLYELIGDCYVHGLMDGEGLHWGLKEQELWLT